MESANTISQGNISWAEFETEMSASINYWLSTTRPDGRPHSMPIWGIWLEQHFVFFTEPQTQKVKNLAVEPFAVVHLESGDNVVIVEGSVQQVVENDWLAKVEQAFSDKYKEPSGEGIKISHYLPQPVIYRVRPVQVRAWRTNANEQSHWKFDNRATQRTIVSPEIAVPEVAPVTPPQPPTDPAHPGSNVYPYQSVYEDTWEVWHEELFAVWPTRVHLFMPNVPALQLPANGFPVLAVSPGKSLGSVAYYRNFLEHVARKGYIVLFVITEAGPLDCEHDRQAKEFLEAINDAINNHLDQSQVSTNQIGWWGHSIGTKVQAIAARITDYPNYRQPTFITAAAFTNAKAFCNADAINGANGIPADITYTILAGADDTIAKPQESQNLYKAIQQVKFKQLIQVNSYKPDKLVANHAAPMTAGSIPLTGLTATTDALDWYGYWKWIVGALQYHFNDGPDNWAYGDKRTDGGTDSVGHQVLHTILQESWGS